MRTPSLLATIALLGLLGALWARDARAIEVAGQLFVELDARDLDPSGTNEVWTNRAPDPSAAGNFVKVGDPIVAEIGGVQCVDLNRFGPAGDSYQSELPAPAGLVGLDPTRTIEVWAYNPQIAAEDTILSWGKRGGPDGSNMAFNYGYWWQYGAVGHWNLDFQDIGWGAVPVAGQWHHLVYTYDGTTTRVYADGQLANLEVLGPGAINTHPNTKIALAEQYLADGVSFDIGLGGTLAVARLRIHDEVLDGAQVLMNYVEEKGDFPTICAPPAFVDPPEDEVTFKGIPYLFLRRLEVDGYPTPTVELLEPAGATLSADGVIAYDLPDPPPASFAVRLRAANCGGSAEASWLVTVRDPPAAGAIEVAEDLIVDLDAADPSAGTDVWTNRAPDADLGAGDFFKVGSPVAAVVDGAPAVVFNSIEEPAGSDAYQSANDAPSGIVGIDPTASIEVWVRSDRAYAEQALVQWGFRGYDFGNASFNWGFAPAWGAMGRWNWPDLGWHRVPATGRWHHLACTFDGIVQRVYVDGRETNYEVVGSGILSTLSGKINLAVQIQPDGITPEWALPGWIALSRVRVHDGALTQEEVLSNYLAEKHEYLEPAPVAPAELPEEPLHRYSFSEDASDSIGGAHGTPYGDVVFAEGQAILGNYGAAMANARGVSPPADPPGAYIDLPNGTISALGDTATFELWATWGGPEGFAWQRYFDFGTSDAGENSSSGGANASYIFLCPWSGVQTLVFAGRRMPGPDGIVEGSVPPIGSEVHLVGVWDRTRKIASLYVNGEKVGDGPATFSLSAIKDVNNWLGRSQWNDPLFKGSYDEFRIYGYALTSGEVLGNYLAGPDVVNLAPAGAEVIRRISKATYAPGETLDVSLAIEMKLGNTAIVVEEKLPSGAAASAISDGGIFASGAIVWDLAGLGPTKTLTYKLTPAPCAGAVDFSRSRFAAGGSRRPIAGDAAISLALADTPLGDWRVADLEAPGSAAQPLGPDAVTVKGTGGGIKVLSKADGFRFVYLETEGDFEFRARIDCQDDPSGAGQGGIMVRDGLEPHAAHAFVGLTSAQPVGGGAGTLAGLYRSATDPAKGNSLLGLTNREVASLPVTIRVRRSATDAKIYFERLAGDGATWQALGSRAVGPTTLDLRDRVLVGLAVSGGGAEARYTFSETSGPAFAGGKPLFHRGDPNDDGALNITDGIFLLNYLFLGGPAPADPGPPEAPCGPDPAGSPGDLGCETYRSC